MRCFCLQLALMIASYFNLLYDVVTTSKYLWMVVCTLLSGFLTWCLVIQILDDPSPTPPEDAYSPEFCSFINDCLQKDADARPTCEQVKILVYDDLHIIWVLQVMVSITPANGAGLDGFFGWVLIRVLLDGWKRVTLWNVLGRVGLTT